MKDVALRISGMGSKGYNEIEDIGINGHCPLLYDIPIAVSSLDEDIR